LRKRTSAAVASSELPLTTRIGIAAVSGSDRSRAMNSSPPIIGIMTSVITRSGRESLTDCKPIRAVARLDDLVAGELEDHPHHEPDIRFVVDDQNHCHRVVP